MPNCIFQRALIAVALSDREIRWSGRSGGVSPSEGACHGLRISCENVMRVADKTVATTWRELQDRPAPRQSAGAHEEPIHITEYLKQGPYKSRAPSTMGRKRVPCVVAQTRS